MPIYEYQCQSCGHAFETMQRLADAPLTTCPQCEGPLKKLISAPAFQFKGSGWYVTDYSRSGGGGGKDSSGKEGGEKGGETRDGGSSDAKSDSGPAESSATKIETPSPSASAPTKSGASSD